MTNPVLLPDLVQELDVTVCDEMLPLVVRAECADIRKLARYHEGTVGEIMQADVLSFAVDITGLLFYFGIVKWRLGL